MGAGIVFLEYDNDGWLDIFVLSGTRFDGAPAGTTSRLYRSNRAGTFADVTEKAGLLRPARWGTGCTWVDYDRDGKLDLLVSNYLVFDPARIARTGQDPNCNWKGIPVNCGPRGPTLHLLGDRARGCSRPGREGCRWKAW
jgi:hypothetical protein